MGVTDVKDTLLEYEDNLAAADRLTATDELNIHILTEQASYELRQGKPEKVENETTEPEKSELEKSGTDNFEKA